MPSALVALANITLGSAQATVTFSSIPATYRDLVLIASINGITGTPTNDGAAMRINSDAGTNYNEVRMAGTGSSATSGSGADNTRFNFQTTENGTISHNIVQFFDYSVTDKHKTILMRATRPDRDVTAIAARWASTAAITSFTLYGPDSFGGTVDTFNAGSTFSLFGVSA